MIRTGWPRVAGEREMLDGLLDWHRQTLLYKCGGLTAQQLTRRAVEPSELSLLGLVRHLTDVERGWFWDLGGEVTFCYQVDGDWVDFTGVDGADAPADLATYQETVERSRALVADASLDRRFTEGDGRSYTLRWVYLHMIEEYARHNGHADLLRERIDGATGE